jgi:pSer/pThr/pTyr-binding forkhead associated (FHA) protein
MFTTAAPAAPTLSATTHTVVVSSGPHSSALPRPSRLRDLSVSLRNYTHSLHHAAGSRANRAARYPDPRSHTAISSHGPHAASATSATSTPTVTPPTSPFTPTPIVVAGLTYFALERRTTAPEASDLPSHPLHPSHPGHHSHHPHRSPAATMTRTRAETAVPQLMMRQHNGPTPASTPAVPTMASFDGQAETPNAQKQPPSIRFIPHQDPRANRPSLQFPTITRSLPDESSVIRVGRYSERDNIAEAPANVPSAASVGFKSKVVSRKHCELWCKDSQWYIKDVKSSSGTFLNHIRLSQPNVESKPFKLKDGDIIQLGIDFRGGEEMIFRCVKIRVECNRGWQQALNTFKWVLRLLRYSSLTLPANKLIYGYVISLGAGRRATLLRHILPSVPSVSCLSQ